ncbi:MAG: IS110 family transposase [Methanotrichaceae archaeon]|nr:IS110 family transposase [Methanotrichaceae archaeon]
MSSIAYVGLDVHNDSIAVAAFAEEGEQPVLERRVANDRLALGKTLRPLEKSYTLRCCYEASSGGYVVQRWLTQMGIDCEVVAPSLIPVRPGDRVKNDRRDARKLARLSRAGELSKVHVPDEADEAVRSLLRCRETMVRETQRSRQYVLKFLALRGLKYGGRSNWTKQHLSYLRGLSFEGADKVTFSQYMALLEQKHWQLEELSRQVEEIAQSERYRERVGRLRCLRGIDTQTAMVVLTEVQDFSRFGSPGALMSYFGLIPSEHSSGSKERRGGITKTGNSRVRRVLVEAAWHYQHKPRMGDSLKKRQAGQPAEVVAHAWKAQHRLHDKFWRLVMRKERCKAAVAVARELTGFIWAIMAEHGQALSKAA